MRAARAPVEESRGAGEAAAGRYAVQVAAYDTKREADALVKRLVARGYKARVVGSAKPWRVRVGSYGTRADANAALGRMKKAGLDGFVTDGG
jgi:DedD protein